MIEIKNEELVKYSNQTQNGTLINMVDKLLVERLPDLVNEELKWICKEFGNEEVSDFLDGDEYYLFSNVLNELIKIYSLPFKN